jgi:hypothetical protein
MVNSRLPHGEFLVFIDSLLRREGDTVRYKTRFPFVPTLQMLCEAGAQGGSFFSFSPHCNAAVVLSYRSVKLFKKLRTNTPQISLSIINALGDSYLLEFKVYEGEDIVSSGEIAVFCTTI